MIKEIRIQGGWDSLLSHQTATTSRQRVAMSKVGTNSSYAKEDRPVCLRSSIHIGHVTLLDATLVGEEKQQSEVRSGRKRIRSYKMASCTFPEMLRHEC